MNKYVFCFFYFETALFFMFNVAKIEYNLTKKNVYDIFNMRLCIKEIFDVKKRIIKIIFNHICF